MSTLAGVLLPDDARYDLIAYATGAEAFDHGVTFDQLRAMDALLTGKEGPPEAMVAWRRSYMEGYLRAMHVLRLKDT